MASAMADNLSKPTPPLSVNSSKKSLRWRARAPMLASSYIYSPISSMNRATLSGVAGSGVQPATPHQARKMATLICRVLSICGGSLSAIM
jgi:hypothetical protein